MKYKCKVEKTVTIVQEIEIDASSQERAELIFERIRKDQDRRSWDWLDPRKDDVTETVDAEKVSVEYVSGEKLPDGVFEYRGATFEPIRKMTYGERRAFEYDPYGSGLAVEGRCESCDWDDGREINEFYDAAYGAADSNWDIHIFRCLEDGFLYAPWKYGLARWGGAEEYAPDYRDLVSDLANVYDDYRKSLDWSAYEAQHNENGLKVRISFDEDSWFPSFGVKFEPEELGHGDIVEKVADALEDHIKAFDYDLLSEDCPVKAAKLSVS